MGEPNHKALAKANHHNPTQPVVETQTKGPLCWKGKKWPWPGGQPL